MTIKFSLKNVVSKVVNLFIAKVCINHGSDPGTAGMVGSIFEETIKGFSIEDKTIPQKITTLLKDSLKLLRQTTSLPEECIERIEETFSSDNIFLNLVRASDRNEFFIEQYVKAIKDASRNIDFDPTDEDINDTFEIFIDKINKDMESDADLMHFMSALEIKESVNKLINRDSDTESCYLKKYLETIKNLFESPPESEKASITGHLSLKEAYIDAYINGNHDSALEYILYWYRNYDPDVYVLYGQPGQGKTTLCLKAVYDYCTCAEWMKDGDKVFYFPLVSSAYSVIDESGNLNIKNILRLDKYSENSVLSDSTLEGSLIFLDGFDELQATLPDTSRYSNLFCFYEFLKDFAKNKKVHIVLTTRDYSVEIMGVEEKKKLNHDHKLLRLSLMDEEKQINWINKHYKDYLTTFLSVKNRYLSLNGNDSKNDILRIPFIFIMVVVAKFDDELGNIADLYDKLFCATMKRRGMVLQSELLDERKAYSKLSFLIYRNNDENTESSKLPVSRSGLKAYAYSYYTKIDIDNGSLDCRTFYAFYHRSFYQYFLAWYIFDILYNFDGKMSNADEFLLNLGHRAIDDYTLRYLEQIKENQFCKKPELRMHFGDKAISLINRIEETDAIVLGEEKLKDRFNWCTNLFVNSINIAQCFIESLVVHQEESVDFSHYVDTPLCQLLRNYKCKRINLNNVILIGGHIDKSNISMSSFRKANLSGKADASFGIFIRSDFSESILSNIDMYRACLDRCTFYYADMRNARLEEASLKKTVIKNTSLEGTDFSRAILRETELYDVSIDEKTSFVNADVLGLQTNVDLSIAKGMQNFKELVEKGIIKYQA